MKKKFSINSKKIISRLIIILILSATIFSARAQTYTLQQVLDSIASRNPGLQQYALQTQSSNAMSESVNAWDAPQIGAGVSEFPYGTIDKSGNQMMPRKMLMLRLQQMFPNFRKQKKEAAYYQSFSKQNLDEKATMQNMLFAKAKMAYYDALIAEKKLNIIDEQTKQLQLLIQIAEGRLAYNKASLPDIYKARAKLGDLKSMRINMSSMIDQSTTIINSLMNRAAGASLQIDTAQNLLQKSELAILQIDSVYVQTHRSDVLHTAAEINSMELKNEMVAASSKPQFGITYDNMRMAGGTYMYNIMAMMTVPIAPWFSKGYKSQTRAADYQIQAMQKMKDNEVQEVLGNIRKDWLRLQSARKDLQIFNDEIIPSYLKTYQAYLNAFSENTGDIYQTLMAWNDLTMKKMEYYDKLSDALNIKAMLETELQTTAPKGEDRY